MKELRIVFAPRKQLTMPFAHFDVLQGVFYNLLSFDPALAAEIHSPSDGRQFKYKFSCFEDLKGKYSVKKKSINYYGEVEWAVRSMNDRVIDTIAEGLMSRPHFEMNHVICDVTSLEEKQKSFYYESAALRMDTPITIYTTDEKGYNNFRNPSNEEFCSMIERNLIRKYTMFYPDKESPSLKIRVLRVSERDKCLTRFKGIIIEAYYGQYEIEAPKDLINLAYYAGLGSKNMQGFGTIRDIRREI